MVERPILKPVGTPAEELDTPALVVDMDALERNLETVHSAFRRVSAKLRPHVEAHRCPAIAHKQLAAGGTVGGISVATVGEAEAFAQYGFDDILVVGPVVTPQKMARLCGLAHQALVTVAVDNPSTVAALSAAAEATGVSLRVLVEVDLGLGRCGVAPGRPATALARAANDAAALDFVGLTGHEGAAQDEDPHKAAAASRRAIQRLLDTRESMEVAGIPVRVVSAGATHSYKMAGAMSGVTEVPAGAYALMDARHRPSQPQLVNAARVLATVISVPEPGLAIVDAGQKAIAADQGLPEVDGVPGASVVSLSAEHGKVRLEKAGLDLGDKVWLIPFDTGACANVYDYVYATREGKLVAIWDVAARGRYR